MSSVNKWPFNNRSNSNIGGYEVSGDHNHQSSVAAELSQNAFPPSLGGNITSPEDRLFVSHLLAFACWCLYWCWGVLRSTPPSEVEHPKTTTLSTTPDSTALISNGQNGSDVREIVKENTAVDTVSDVTVHCSEVVTRDFSHDAKSNRILFEGVDQSVTASTIVSSVCNGPVTSPSDQQDAAAIVPMAAPPTSTIIMVSAGAATMSTNNSNAASGRSSKPRGSLLVNWRNRGDALKDLNMSANAPKFIGSPCNNDSDNIDCNPDHESESVTMTAAAVADTPVDKERQTQDTGGRPPDSVKSKLFRIGSRAFGMTADKSQQELVSTSSVLATPTAGERTLAVENNNSSNNLMPNSGFGRVPSQNNSTDKTSNAGNSRLTSEVGVGRASSSHSVGGVAQSPKMLKRTPTNTLTLQKIPSFAGVSQSGTASTPVRDCVPIGAFEKQFLRILFTFADYLPLDIVEDTLNRNQFSFYLLEALDKHASKLSNSLPNETLQQNVVLGDYCLPAHFDEPNRPLPDQERLNNISTYNSSIAATRVSRLTGPGASSPRGDATTSAVGSSGAISSDSPHHASGSGVPQRIGAGNLSNHSMKPSATDLSTPGTGHDQASPANRRTLSPRGGLALSPRGSGCGNALSPRRSRPSYSSSKSVEYDNQGSGSASVFSKLVNSTLGSWWGSGSGKDTTQTPACQNTIPENRATPTGFQRHRKSKTIPATSLRALAGAVSSLDSDAPLASAPSSGVWKPCSSDAGISAAPLTPRNSKTPRRPGMGGEMGGAISTVGLSRRRDNSKMSNSLVSEFKSEVSVECQQDVVNVPQSLNRSRVGQSSKEAEPNRPAAKVTPITPAGGALMKPQIKRKPKLVGLRRPMSTAPTSLNEGDDLKAAEMPVLDAMAAKRDSLRNNVNINNQD
eukprot:Lankesteria_metandrocarpae@DN7198_c0_g1_i1.p1